MNESISHPKTKLLLRSHKKVLLIPSNKIVVLSAEGAYTRFHLVTGEKIMMSKPLKYYQKILAKDRFVRCHNSYLANLDYFVEYNTVKNRALFSRIEIPVSRRHQKELLTSLITMTPEINEISPPI